MGSLTACFTEAGPLSLAYCPAQAVTSLAVHDSCIQQLKVYLYPVCILWSVTYMRGVTWILPARPTAGIWLKK